MLFQKKSVNVIPIPHFDGLEVELFRTTKEHWISNMVRQHILQTNSDWAQPDPED